MVVPVGTKPTNQVSHGHSPLGFRHLVAPLGKTAVSWDSGSFDPPLPGYVSGLPREILATSKVAPSLHRALRSALEGRQVQTKDIDLFLKGHRGIEGYNSGFRILWAVCQVRGLDPFTASLHQVASQLLYLHSISPSCAKNAYCALLLFPGLDQLRFCSLLTQVK